MADLEALESAFMVLAEDEPANYKDTDRSTISSWDMAPGTSLLHQKTPISS